MPDYGWKHQKLRQQMLAALEPGAPCVRCGGPMFPSRHRLDLDHAADGHTYRGLAHARCNRKAGGIKGNRILAARRTRSAANTQSRRW